MGYLAVIIAGAASFAFGAAWYMAFAKPWMEATDIKTDENGNPESGPCCTDQLQLGTRPTRDGFQAVRSKLGRPSSVIRLSMRTPILASFF